MFNLDAEKLYTLNFQNQYSNEAETLEDITSVQTYNHIIVGGGNDELRDRIRGLETLPQESTPTEDSKYLSHFSPLNGSNPIGMTPFTESLKSTYDRVVPFFKNEIQKNLAENKNVLVSAHGNSLRALWKYLFNISDKKINELEIPTGNPLVIEFDGNLKVEKYYYLDKSRAKDIIFNQ